MEVFKLLIQRSTHNQIQVQLYPASSLVGQDAEVPALERNDIQMANVSAAEMAPQVPYTAMFTAAYTFKDYNAMINVLNGKIGKSMFADIDKKTGALPLVAWYLGSRELNYRNIGRTIKTPADMQGVKLRMPDSPAWLALGSSLGGNPVPLAFTEVYTALQSGTVDAQDNPMPTDESSKFYEVAKNISLTNHVVDSVWPAINAQVWQQMGPALQKKMIVAIDRAGTYMDKATLKREASLLNFFAQHGVTIVKPDIAAFQAYAQQYYLDHPQSRVGWDMTLYKKVQAVNKSVK